uniref:Uncharacterized protein n=1 Tax=Oryza brachyantha TaxID=4533 RepID=J3KU98_ORYBR
MQQGRGQGQRRDLEHGSEGVELEQRLRDETTVGDGEGEERGVELGVGAAAVAEGIGGEERRAAAPAGWTPRDGCAGDAGEALEEEVVGEGGDGGRRRGRRWLEGGGAKCRMSRNGDWDGDGDVAGGVGGDARFDEPREAAGVAALGGRHGGLDSELRRRRRAAPGTGSSEVGDDWAWGIVGVEWSRCFRISNHVVRASRSFSQGHMDIELNETGKQQAVMSELGVASYEYLKLGLVVTWKVARRLANEAKPAAVYSSDLKRAADTAQTIATACNVSYLVLNPALRERHMGDLHGLKFDDAVRSKPDAYKAFTSEDRSQEIPGGGESLDQLSDRCVSYLNTIASKHKGERVIVVTHGASIEELCRHADPTSSVPRRIPNTSICVFHISGTTGHWILERFGDVAHLMEVSFPKTAFGGDGASA